MSRLLDQADIAPDKRMTRRIRQEATHLRIEINFSGHLDLLDADLMDPRVARDWSAGTRALQNDLRLALDAWPEIDEDSDSSVGATQRLLMRIHVRACELVLPDKIERRLDHYRLGKPLSLMDEFDHELPDDPALRAAVIQRVIAQVGRVENGIADPSNGVFYRRSSNALSRGFAYAAPGIAFILGGLALLLVAQFSDWFEFDSGWHLSNAQGMIGSYVVMVAGAIVHMLVESTKQSQSDNTKVTPITDGLDWLYLRWPGVVLSLVWMVVGVIMLRVTGIGATGTNTQQLAISFATGYSLDSVIGIWITRFDSAATKSVGTLSDLMQAQGTQNQPPRGVTN